jgi:sugar-specific transcriptional regulator TrmB
MNNLVSLLGSFGLGDEESAVYLFLLEKGVKSALEISRGVKMGRTKVYRLLEMLTGKGLVSQKLDDMGFKFLANDYYQLEMLVKQKEADLENLRRTLPVVYDQLAGVVAESGEKSKVLYYHGIQGLSQVTWNSTRGDSEGLRIFEVAQSMTAFLDQKFSEKVRAELVRNKVFTRQLTNYSHLDACTKVRELVKFWEVRYIDPKIMKIDFEYLVYNNVYATYNWSGEDKFCVEIYNDKLASTQKKLFDFIWSSARRMKFVGDCGEAVLA